MTFQRGQRKCPNVSKGTVDKFSTRRGPSHTGEGWCISVGEGDNSPIFRCKGLLARTIEVIKVMETSLTGALKLWLGEGGADPKPLYASGWGAVIGQFVKISNKLIHRLTSSLNVQLVDWKQFLRSIFQGPGQGERQGHLEKRILIWWVFTVY